VPVFPAGHRPAWNLASNVIQPICKYAKYVKYVKQAYFTYLAFDTYITYYTYFAYSTYYINTWSFRKIVLFKHRNEGTIKPSDATVCLGLHCLFGTLPLFATEDNVHPRCLYQLVDQTNSKNCRVLNDIQIGICYQYAKYAKYVQYAQKKICTICIICIIQNMFKYAKFAQFAK